MSEDTPTTPGTPPGAPTGPIWRRLEPSLRLKTMAFATLLTIFAALLSAASVWWTLAGELITREEERLAESAHDAAQQFASIVGTTREDALMLAGAPAIRGVLRASENGGTDPVSGLSLPVWQDRAIELLRSALVAKPIYHQARLIRADAAGREMLRVDRVGDGATARIVTVTGDDLRSQGKRSYFRDGLRLKPGEVSVSPIEVNQEYGASADSSQPVIIATVPVFDTRNRLFGLIVLSADLRGHFASLPDFTPTGAEVRVINTQGGYLWRANLRADAAPGNKRVWRIEQEFPGFTQAFGSAPLVRQHRPIADRYGHMHVLGAHEVRVGTGSTHSNVRFLYSSSYASVHTRAFAGYPRVLVAIALVLLVCLPLAFVFGSAISSPLTDMTNFLTAWTPDSLRHRLPVDRHDEIGLLAREFSRLLESLAERQHRLQHEVDERRHAENATRGAEARLHAVIDTMLDGVVVSDVHGVIISVNPAIEKMFGYTAADLLGQPVALLARESRRADQDKFVKNAGKHGLDILGLKRQLFAQRKNGEVFPIELVLNRFETDRGWFYSAVIRDLTEQHAVEAELRRMATAVEHAADAIVIQANDGQILYVNVACERICEMPRSELIGKTPRVLQLSADPPEYYQALLDTVARGEVWSGILRQRVPSGKVVNLESNVSPIRDTDGNIAYRVSVMRDITERLALESQLAQAQKLESIGQLAAGIAHEINTPAQYVGDNIRFVRDSFTEMNALLGALQQLATSGEPLARTLTETLQKADLDFLREEIPKALEQSADGCQRISSIVKAMKEFSHPGADKTPVDLNRAIQSTITVATNEWKYVAEIRTEFDPALPHVTCLPGEFNQVILNMLVNAAHAITDVVGDGARGKGVITVTTRQVGEFAEIRISDTGCGITPEIREKIFDPFFTTKQVGKGTGQGLAIAHDVIVNKHGGTIGLESEPGKGSTFIIKIPVNPVQTQARARGAVAA